MDNPPDKQLNIFISPEMTQELKDAARRETERLKELGGLKRKQVTKSGLAFEIFIWAIDFYRDSGSLAELKARYPAPARIADQVEQEKELLGPDEGSGPGSAKGRQKAR